MIHGTYSKPKTAKYPATEGDFGGLQHWQFLQSCLASLKAERIIQCSPRGKKALEVLQYLEGADERLLADISKYLVDEINGCVAGSRHKLVSSAMSHVWTSFHRLRSCTEVYKVWSKFISIRVPKYIVRNTSSCYSF